MLIKGKKDMGWKWWSTTELDKILWGIKVLSWIRTVQINEELKKYNDNLNMDFELIMFSNKQSCVKASCDWSSVLTIPA